MTVVRTVLTVVLALTLLGISIGTLSDIRGDHTASQLGVERDEFAREAVALAAGSSAVRRHEPGARTTVSITVPGGSLATLAPDLVVIGCPAEVLEEDGSTIRDRSDVDHARTCDPAFIYRISGEDPVVLPVPEVDLDVSGEPIRLEPGSTELLLRLVTDSGRDVVSVSRA